MRAFLCETCSIALNRCKCKKKKKKKKTYPKIHAYKIPMCPNNYVQTSIKAVKIGKK